MYVVSPDDLPPLGTRLCLLAGVRLLDELTGQPPAASISVTTGVTYADARVAEGGLVGLVGIPRRAFPALASNSYVASFTVDADGYMPRTVAVSVPMDPTFPATFTPPAISDLPLHRLPTVFRGRVVQKTGGKSVPLVGASVAVTGIWQMPPPATATVPPAPPNTVSLKPALYFDRAASTGQFQTIVFTPVSGQDKTLLDAVMKGANAFRLSDAENLNVGDVVLIDPDDPDLAEYLPIVSIAGGSSSDQPAQVTFAYAPFQAHARGTLVRKVIPGAVGPIKIFARDAWLGDACLFLNNVTGLVPVQAVQISGGAAATEYHVALTFVAQTDGNGYYRLPPLSRVAQLEVNASQLTLMLDQIVQPDYSLSENVLDFPIQ